MFSFQGASLNLFFKKLNETSNLLGVSVSFFLLHFVFLRSGGPKWTRTIDLTIISRVL